MSCNEDGNAWNYQPEERAVSDFLFQNEAAAFRFVLTHASRDEDRRLRDIVTAPPRTYFLGGHDHDIDWIEVDSSPLLMKNLANLQTVRVLLLLAGGDAAMNKLLEGYRAEKSFPSQRKARESLQAVLRHVHPLDAMAFQNDLTAGTDLRPVGPQFFQEECELHTDYVAQTLGQLPFRKDVWSHTLKFDDHEPAPRALRSYVDSLVHGAEGPNERKVVHDFTSQGHLLFDARDASLRHRTTDFGSIVAECIRLHAQADIAVVNSGSFRSDSKIPAKLLVRDLRETFLYDSQDAIVVLKLAGELIDELLSHGRTQKGLGAYPQVSDARQQGVSPVVIAISRYLLSDGSIDGYLEIVSRRRGILPKSVGAWVKSSGAPVFSIVDAISQQATRVVPQVQPPPLTADEFIRLVQEYTEVFHSRIGKGRPEATKNQLYPWLLLNRPLTSDPEVQAAHAGIRDFLTRLWKHVEKQHSKAPARFAELSDFQAKLTDHPQSFRQQLDYGEVFRKAASGVPGLKQSVHVFIRR